MSTRTTEARPARTLGYEAPAIAQREAIIARLSSSDNTGPTSPQSADPALTSASPAAPVAAVRHSSGVLHESFYAPSGADRLFASLYQPSDRAARHAVLLCPPWGVEGMTLTGWGHRFAHDLARSGVAAVLPQWPGTGDSDGDPATMTFPRLVEAGVDVVRAASARVTSSAWSVAGVRVGAAIAALVGPDLPAERVVLVQPSLDPAAYFADLERQSRRGRLGAASDEGWAFGHPHPPGLTEPGWTERVAEALASHRGEGVVVRYRTPAPTTPTPFRTVVAWGDWRRPSRIDHGPLRIDARRWLLRSLGAAR